MYQPSKTIKDVVEKPYFLYWVDLFMPKIANIFLPAVSNTSFITPNAISILSFIIHFFGSICLILLFPYHLATASILLLLSYIADCLDGQLARYTIQFSPIGDYLDKTLDVLKIFIFTVCLSYAIYINTHSIVTIYLGFTACFFFLYRYYIKHTVLLNRMSKDSNYLKNSSARRKELIIAIEKKYSGISNTVASKFKTFLLQSRSLFFYDEGEIIFFSSILIFFGRLDLALYLLVVSQIVNALFRYFQRANQLQNDYDFLDPIRR